MDHITLPSGRSLPNIGNTGTKLAEKKHFVSLKSKTRAGDEPTSSNWTDIWCNHYIKAPTQDHIETWEIQLAKMRNNIF